MAQDAQKEITACTVTGTNGMKISEKTKIDAMRVDCNKVKQQSTNHHIEALSATPQEAEMTWKVSEIKLNFGSAKKYL